MQKKLLIALTLVLLLSGCGSAPAPEATPPVEPPTDASAKAPLPTVTLAPIETSLPEPTSTSVSTETSITEPTSDPSVFGFVSSANAPTGYMLEPIAQAIFELELRKRVDAGEIGDFQVEGLSIVPRGDGTFFAEIYYAVQADASLWPEDFGTPSEDGWGRGKCTRFDFEMMEDGYYLKNKAVCN